MKSIKILCSLLLVLTVCSAFSLKGSKSVYIVGVSASFTDSLVYFTEIQLLDSVSLDKNKMLPERSQYSYQLKNYLENEEGLTNRTCFVYFSNSRKKLQKTINKMKTNVVTFSIRRPASMDAPSKLSSMAEVATTWQVKSYVPSCNWPRRSILVPTRCNG